MKVVLIVGSTGAGKTTHSLNIAKELGAVVYSIDNWMKALYWPDMPKNPDNNWFVENSQWYTERISRCEALILSEVLARAKLNQNSILDLGFSTSEHRKRFIGHLLKVDIEVQVHFLDLPADLRWQRVQKRNLEQAETFVMNVDRDMFDFMESIFELPTEKEGAPVKRIGLN